MTAVTVLAEARTAASMMRISSMIFSAGLFVGCMMNTSLPRMFSSNLIHNSPSENVLIVSCPNSLPRDFAIPSAKTGLLRPVNIFKCSSIISAGAQGLEPRLPGPKPGVLPLDDAPILYCIERFRCDSKKRGELSRIGQNGLMCGAEK